MGILRTIFHIATLGIVDSNEEVKRKNPLKTLDFQGILAEGVRFELTRP